MDDLKGKNIVTKLVSLAKIAPLNGYIGSGDFRVLELKERFDVSNYYVADILEQLENDGEIRELYVNYDVDDRHILSFKFR